MSGRISVVHNGIIENYLELKERLKEKGVVFLSETDTEVVAHLFEDLYDGDMISTTRKLLQEIRGAYALGILCSEHPDTLVAVRKGRPLLVGLGKGENYIASDIPALLEYTRDYYLLDEYEIAVLKNDGVTLVDIEGNEIKKEIYHVTWDIAAAEKGGYDYFMMKEIMEQPEVLTKTIQPRLTETDIKLDEISLTEEESRNCGRIKGGPARKAAVPLS
jgi:glucosamine--fructose-6-phosphate aminotransferase (isomerizing)